MHFFRLTPSSLRNAKALSGAGACRRSRRTLSQYVQHDAPRQFDVSTLKAVEKASQAHALVKPAGQTSAKDGSRKLSPFEELGVRQDIAAALHMAFPNITAPTPTQKRLIPFVLEGRDVLLEDHTGTGKTFGLLLALLNMKRLPLPLGRTKPSITSLFLVPHRDLAFQMLHWLELLAASAGSSAENIRSMAQVLVRDSHRPLDAQAMALAEQPPHVLISTPQAALDMHKSYPSTMQLDKLMCLVVDEVDYQVDSVPNRRNRYQVEIARRRLEKHPSPTKQLLDEIYAKRVATKHRLSEFGDYTPKPGKFSRPFDGPQLVLSSATLREHLRSFVRFSGWLSGRYPKAIGGEDRRATSTTTASKTTAPSDIRHYALVVSKAGEIRNIHGAVQEIAEAIDSSPVHNAAVDEGAEATEPAVDDTYLDKETKQKFAATSSPYNATALEAVATVFALDVPSLALLVLPPSASVKRAIYDFRELGLDARGLDLLDYGRGKSHLLRDKENATNSNPTLLVCTLASTRGLDLPLLTHVFILGVPEGKRHDVYLHTAGRVGRFHREGKVFSILEESREDKGGRNTGPDDDTGDSGELGKDTRGEPRIMNAIYKQLNITPHQFAHFP